MEDYAFHVLSDHHRTVPPERSYDKMVSPKNVDGSLITVLLVTKHHFEGVNLHVRECTSWTLVEEGSEQIVGRVARYMSHAAAPKERNLVYHHVCHPSDIGRHRPHVSGRPWTSVPR
jgi:hypothetical protein